MLADAINAPTTSSRSLPSIRSRTRRRLHQPRPAVSHETRKRIGQWKAEVKAAAKDRQIRAVDRLYADELLAFPSVTRGHYSLCSDATMGQRLDVSDSTARRRRRRLDKAGLIEVLGYGQDGNSCLVRPILRDGTPVFPDPEMPSRPVNSDHPPRSELTADLSTKTPTPFPRLCWEREVRLWRTAKVAPVTLARNLRLWRTSGGPWYDRIR